jgi:hypothetical protein
LARYLLLSEDQKDVLSQTTSCKGGDGRVYDPPIYLLALCCSAMVLLQACSALASALMDAGQLRKAAFQRGAKSASGGA